MTKRLLFLLLASFLMLVVSCKVAPEKPAEFRILPSPQQVEITGVSDLSVSDIKYSFSNEEINLPLTNGFLSQVNPAEDPSFAQLILELDEAMEIKREGYSLDILKDQIHIKAKDSAGLLYGKQTLEQLMEDAVEQDVNLPLCHIVDYPELAYRAIHIDIKHHRERKDYYFKMMDELAKLKINAIIAEVEDKIKFERQPLVGSEDAFSIEEWKELSDYAQARNIEISPLVQGLGHASFILKHEAYKDLRDNLESDWAFDPLNPKTYEVQFDLYQDAIDAMPHGRYLHVGGDEVHTTGRGSGQSALELQLIWLNKVCQFAEEQGRIPIFWDDMPLKHAGVYRAMFQPNLTQEEVDSIWGANEHKLLDFLDLFPKNCIYMRWNYHSPQAIGNGKTMEWFRNNGLNVMGATAGQTRWVLMPQRESNIQNIKTFALSSIENDLNGLLLTLWDDDSPHFELYWRGISAFAEYTWAGEKRSNAETKMAYRHRAFGQAVANEAFAFIDNLEAPVGFWKQALMKNGSSRNALATMENGIEAGVIDLPLLDQKGEWTKTHEERLTNAQSHLLTCDTISLQLQKMKDLNPRNVYRLEVYEQINELVKYSLRALTIIEKYDSAALPEERTEALGEIKTLSAKFDALRSKFETVYSKTKKLDKPDSYILDQDHHHHLANQSTSMDWQFLPEMLFLEKINAFLEEVR